MAAATIFLNKIGVGEMVSIKDQDGSFSYRVAGIIIHNNKILLQQAIKTDTWILPGGRSEINETSEKAVIREMKEELGVDVRAKRLIWIIENFNAYGIDKLHELGLYYLVEIINNEALFDIANDFKGIEETKNLIFRWISINEIKNLNIYPMFLKSNLTQIPESIQHIINRDF